MNNRIDQSPDMRISLHDKLHGKHGPPHRALFIRDALLDKAKTTRSATSTESFSRTFVASNTAVASTQAIYSSTTTFPTAIESAFPISFPSHTISTAATSTLAPIAVPTRSAQREVPLATFIAVIVAICILLFLLAGVLFCYVYRRRYENRKFPISDEDPSESKGRTLSTPKLVLRKWKRALMPAHPANLEISPIQRDNKGRNMIQVTKSIVSTINPTRSVYVDSYYIQSSSVPSLNKEIPNRILKAQHAQQQSLSASVSTAIQILPPLQTSTRSRQSSAERTLETEGERILQTFEIRQHNDGDLARPDSPYTDIGSESGIHFASAAPSIVAPKASRGSIDLRRLSASLDEDFSPLDDVEELTLPGMTPSPAPPDVNTDDSAPCSLCKTRFRNTDMVIELPCTHVHHAKCLKEWFTSVVATCPHCRRDYSKVEMNDDSQNLATFSSESERRQSQLQTVASERPFRLNEFVPALRKQMAPSESSTSRATSIASTAKHNLIGTAF